MIYPENGSKINVSCPKKSKNHIEDTDLETTILYDNIISRQLNKNLNQVWVATYYTNLQKFLKHIKLWKFESRRRLGKKNAAMVDREDKSTQTTEIFVGKISGRKHGIVGNV